MVDYKQNYKRSKGEKIMLKTKTKLNKKEYNTVRRTKSMRKSYTIIIHKDCDVNSYWAECPAIPHVHAQADTIEELKKLMAEAIEFHLESIGVNELPDEEIFSTMVSLEVQNA